MRRLLLAGAATALLFPAGASAATLHGTVVHRVGHAHSFVIASRGGALRAVHSARRPHIGRTVSVRARALSNGTFSARSVRVARTARHHARLRGVVTHVSRTRHAFVLSARGVSLVVHRSGRARSARAAAAGLPRVGDDAVVEATLRDDGEIEADEIDEQGEDRQFEIEGVVQAVDQGAGTLTVSSDDDDELGSDTVVHFPAGTDLSGFAKGQEVELEVTRGADGTLTAVSGGRDDEQGDDDQGEQEHEVGDDGTPERKGDD